jgi:hypothetical protein
MPKAKKKTNKIIKGLKGAVKRAGKKSYPPGPAIKNRPVVKKTRKPKKLKKAKKGGAQPYVRHVLNTLIATVNALILRVVELERGGINAKEEAA